MQGPQADADWQNARPGDGPVTPLLIEFAVLWSRGFADEDKLWALFDRCEMYLPRPDYFGAPVFRTPAGLVTPVFSTLDQLTEFATASPELGPGSGAAGVDWVRLTGEKMFGLPVRARLLAIDPGTDHGTVIDLAARPNPPAWANGAPPFAINLELSPNGVIVGAVHTPTGMDAETEER